MEQRLAEFRANRRASSSPTRVAPASGNPAATETGDRASAQAPTEESGQRSENHEAQIITSPLPWWLHYVLKNELFLKFLLWLVLLGLFVELEFGLPYFVLSMFYWIYVGTRGPRERQPGEKSAYSVFNPGCEAIQGTLTAEQFERELQYRPLIER
ncbi:SAYSvFN domain-containing protein 1 [Ahaetulla prasina]|uniref:SAYSvFN domain-containing protein 1 n=1 Tax=Ahaetulla prasina TaxID=499056 RepID=UPI002648E1EA|nr:SAYSvFN domain-containing protein 1 [Ahaetulla prasina]